MPDGTGPAGPGRVSGLTRDWRSLGSIPFHPLLAAAYPVVFLFAANASEQVTTRPILLPLAVSVGSAAAVLVILGLVTRNWHGAGLVTTVLVIGFFGYGHAWNMVASSFPRQLPFLVIWIALLFAAVWLVTGARHGAARATRFLNLVTLVLVVANAWSLGNGMVARASAHPIEGDIDAIMLHPPDGDLPDVYYLIVDRYAGPTALRETYGYDDEPFLSALEDRGFNVARHAHANYIKTPLSLVSSLNMRYLDADVLEASATSGRDRGPIQRQLSQHLAVPVALKGIGYSYIHVANWWEPTSTNVDADLVFRYDGLDEFSNALIQTTMLRAFVAPMTAPDDPYDWEVMRENNLYALGVLEDIPSLPGPKYVFAHLVTTHPPYVHNPDGSMTGREQVAELGDLRSYVLQMEYANTRLLGIVDRIIANDPDAVIVLQADEGPYPLRYDADDYAFRWAQATPAELEQKFGILYAMRVPGADVVAAGFGDDRTPVNAFRIVFDARFGANLPLLPDRVYAHVDLDHFYDFIDVTDRVDHGG